MVTKRISANVLLDPSLILAQRSLDHTFQIIRYLNETDPSLRFYCPQSFLRIIDSRDPSLEMLSEYFLSGAHPADPTDIRTRIQENSEMLSGYEARYDAAQRYPEIYENLRWETSYLGRPFGGYILNILLEEWIFLQGESWIVSRIKKPFTRFIDAGAACLQFGSKAVDSIIRKSIKKDSDELLSRVDEPMSLYS